jgi:hypothetical protein
MIGAAQPVCEHPGLLAAARSACSTLSSVSPRARQRIDDGAPGQQPQPHAVYDASERTHAASASGSPASIAGALAPDRQPNPSEKLASRTTTTVHQPDTGG